MTTDDDMREIEAALDGYENAARTYRNDDEFKRSQKMRADLLALIRQKLPQTDAEHELAVEAWRSSAMAVKEGLKFYLDRSEIYEALRLMRASAAGTAAGELLRAAKDVLHNFHVDMEQEHRRGFYGPQDVDAMHAMGDAIEAAERAGVR